MASITIKFKNGTVKEFPHVGRPGGSYTKKVEYKGNFAIIVDEWYNETAYPMDIIEEIKVGSN